MDERALAESGLNLPEKTLTKLSALCDQVERALGDDFVGALLYGSAARADWIEGKSDINLMIVASEARLVQCAAITRHLRHAQRVLPLHAEIITPLDLERSADVFPLKFLDIQRNHVVLRGEDPLARVEIAWDHLRLRVEQKLKSVVFSLRHNYLLYERQPEQLVRAMAGQLSVFLAGLGALMFLQDGQWWISGKDAIVRAVPEAFDLDEDLLDNLLALQRRQINLDTEQLQALYASFMIAAEEVAILVDRLGEEEEAAEEELTAGVTEGEEVVLGDESLDVGGEAEEPEEDVELASRDEEEVEIAQEAS